MTQPEHDLINATASQRKANAQQHPGQLHRGATEQELQKVRDFAVEAARLCHDRHCEDIVIFDVAGLSTVTDFILIASGTSDRQLKAVGSEITVLGKEQGVERIGNDRDQANTWLVLDFVDLVVHLFEPSTRAYYDIEMLWGDAKAIPWQREN